MPSNDSQIVTLVNGQQVGMAVYGADDGFPILGFHGAPASRLTFELADKVARNVGFKLYCPDRPGCGLTPAAEPVTLAARVEIFSMLADALGLKRFGLLSISGGAPYATALAANLGDRIAVLALVSPKGPIADLMVASEGHAADVHRGHHAFFLKVPKYPRLLKACSVIAARAFLTAPHSFGAMFAKTQSQPDRDILAEPELADAIIRMTKEALRQGVDGAVADLTIYSAPWNIDYTQISATTVIWQGTCDRVVPVAATRYLSGMIPHAVFIELPDAGHFWICNNISEVFAHLRGAIYDQDEKQIISDT